jgi:hypothetical protein
MHPKYISLDVARYFGFVFHNKIVKQTFYTKLRFIECKYIPNIVKYELDIETSANLGYDPEEYYIDSFKTEIIKHINKRDLAVEELREAITKYILELGKPND